MHRFSTFSRTDGNRVFAHFDYDQKGTLKLINACTDDKKPINMT